MPLYELHDLLAQSFADDDPLIEGVVTAHDKILWVAQYKAGKSVIELQKAHCVAGGHPFLGFRVPRPRVVLYVAGEGGEDELQERSRNMGQSLPVSKNMLWFWPLPEYPLNTDDGQKYLTAAADAIHDKTGEFPALTIFDPAYALMSGGMRNDEDVGRFVRVCNLYQAYTQGAVIIVQHTHRNIRNSSGEVIEEGDEAFFGSMLWKAWPKNTYLLRSLKDKSRDWSASEPRRWNAIKDNPVKLTLVENADYTKDHPLLFVRHEEGVNPGAALIREVLRVHGPMTQAELEDLTKRPRSSIVEGLQAIQADKTGRPAKYSIKE